MINGGFAMIIMRIPELFVVNGHKIILKRSLDVKIYTENNEWYYKRDREYMCDIDELFIYLSSSNRKELYNNILKEIFYSILIYAKEDDNRLSPGGKELIYTLLNLVEGCKKVT